MMIYLKNKISCLIGSILQTDHQDFSINIFNNSTLVMKGMGNFNLILNLPYWIRHIIQAVMKALVFSW